MDTQPPIGSSKGCCATCGLETKLRCVRCAEGLSKDGKLCQIFYCSRTCQTAQWSTHKTECKNANYRKQVYRAGILAQDIYYGVRESTYNMKIAAVEESGEKLIIDLPHSDTDENFHPMVKFPSQFFKNEQDRHAMLSYFTGTDGADKVFELVRDALNGTYLEIQDVVVIIPNGKGRIKAPVPNLDSLHTHVTYKVFLKDGNSYAFDVTAAQFGLYRTVTPWKTHQQDLMVDNARLNTSTFGTFVARARASENMVIKVNSTGPVIAPGVMILMQSRMSDCLKAAVAEFVETKGKRVADMVCTTKEDFTATAQELQDHVSTSIPSFTKWMEETGGSFKRAQDPDIFLKYQAVKKNISNTIDAGMSKPKSTKASKKSKKKKAVGATGVIKSQEKNGGSDNGKTVDDDPIFAGMMSALVEIADQTSRGEVK